MNVLERAGRFAAGDDTPVELEELPSLFSFSSLSSGICCSAGLYIVGTGVCKRICTNL